MKLNSIMETVSIGANGRMTFSNNEDEVSLSLARAESDDIYDILVKYCVLEAYRDEHRRSSKYNEEDNPMTKDSVFELADTILSDVLQSYSNKSLSYTKSKMQESIKELFPDLK